LKVKQGDVVKADAILAVLSSRKDRELECTLADLQLQEAQTQSDAIKVAGEKKLAAIDAEIQQLRDARELDLRAQDTKLTVLAAQAKSAQNQWDRVKGLQRSGVSTQELERSELLVQQANGELAAARTLRKKTEIGYDNNEKISQARKAAAQAELDEALKRLPIDSAKQNLKIAQRRRDSTEIKAPVAGTILKINSREGEATGAQPILQLADTQAMVAVVEVYESDVTDLDAWLKNAPVSATITSRAFAGTVLKGELKAQQITRLIQQNQVFSMNPREAIDRRVIEVRVDIDPASTELASRYIGLQVEVDLEPKP
jgi:HlyD family secretion protein